MFDTNILVRMALSRSASISRLWHGLRLSSFILVLGPSILLELERVLSYPRIADRYGLTSSSVGTFIQDLRSLAVILEDLYHVSRVESDATDDIFLACAYQSGADYLVTEDPHLGSLKHFYGTQIIGLRQFCNALKQ